MILWKLWYSDITAKWFWEYYKTTLHICIASHHINAPADIWWQVTNTRTAQKVFWVPQQSSRGQAPGVSILVVWRWWQPQSTLKTWEAATLTALHRDVIVVLSFTQAEQPTMTIINHIFQFLQLFGTPFLWPFAVVFPFTVFGANSKLFSITFHRRKLLLGHGARVPPPLFDWCFWACSLHTGKK